jgi:hypothetical protein
MVDHIHTIIRQDLITNQKDLFNMYEYYTHKYRSNDRLLDINVGLFRNDKQQLTAQIYVADKNTKIREQLILDEKYNLIDTDILIKRYE